MKAVSQEIVVDYYQIMKGEQPYLFETWVRSLKDKFEDFFIKATEPKQAVFIKTLGTLIELNPSFVVVRGTLQGSANYYILPVEQFKEDFKRSNK